MTFTDTLSLCIVSGVLALFFWRLRRRAISKGKFLFTPTYINKYNWPLATTFWDIPMSFCGIFCVSLFFVLFET